MDVFAGTGIGFSAGVILGGTLVYFWVHAKYAGVESESKFLKEKVDWFDQARGQLRELFQSLASEVLQKNSEQILHQNQSTLQPLIQPLKEDLDKLDGVVRELETKREGAYQSLAKDLEKIEKTNQDLYSITANLTKTLSPPTVSGKWGEMQLRRLVEMAGMTAHVDFEEQTATSEGRPDMIIHLPQQGILPVDAKTSLNSYFEAVEAQSETEKKEKLEAHAANLRKQMKNLAKKEYGKQFNGKNDMVVMFVPVESSLNSAFNTDKDLFDAALKEGVLLCAPITLFALLKAVSLGWMQQQLAENAKQIADQGKELYDRLLNFARDLTEVGKNLGSVVKDWNKTVGSWENRLLPAVHRLKEMGGGMQEISSLSTIEQEVRSPKI